MPYKDPEKRKKCNREAMSKARAEARETERADDDQAETEAAGFGSRPMVEDAEAAYGDETREKTISNVIIRQYGKSRTWACIMYADSAPADWEDKLRMIGVPFAVSPLHDKDVTALGQPKKPHWHVILDWPGGATTYRTAAGISKGILGGTIPIPLASPRGYYRYFTHLDNPNKAQYDEQDIIRGNGFDISSFLELTAKEKLELKKKVVREIIIPLGITEYKELFDYVMFNEGDDVIDLVSNCTLFFQGYLHSARYMAQLKK